MAFDLNVDQGVARLLLAKPPVNALDSREWAQLADHITTLGRDANVRVVILAAEVMAISCYTKGQESTCRFLPVSSYTLSVMTL